MLGFAFFFSLLKNSLALFSTFLGAYSSIDEIPESIVHDHEKNGLPRLSSFSDSEIKKPPKTRILVSVLIYGSELKIQKRCACTSMHLFLKCLCKLHLKKILSMKLHEYIRTTFPCLILTDNMQRIAQDWQVFFCLCSVEDN